MKKTLEFFKILIVLLIAIVISVIAFCGVFVKKQGIWSNAIPDYKYGMDIEGARELRYALSTDEEEKNVYVDENGNVMGEVLKDGNPVTEEEETTAEESEEVQYAKEKRNIKKNEDSNLTKENFELSKQIIQKRLQAQEIEEYNIRIDDVTGKLQVETVNDEDTVGVVEDLISQNGKFEIIDYQNGLVLMDNSDIKNVSVVSSNNSGYSTYLQIQFNKEGKEKLRDISNKYVEIKSENTENESTEESEDSENEETEKKYVSIVFDDTTMMTTYFGEEMSDGILQISVGNQTTEYDKFIESYKSAKRIADILNSGILPITYELETDNFVQSNVTEKNLNNIEIGIAVLAVIVSIGLIIKYKKNGLLVSIVSIGYIALLSIVIRYTNVNLTLSGIVMTILSIILNYIFVTMLLNKTSKNDDSLENYKQVFKEFNLTILPMYAIALVFTLSKNAIVNSMGMVAFWGMILILLYNIIFTRIVLNKGDIKYGFKK